jgi:hypothetical protein
LAVALVATIPGTEKKLFAQDAKPWRGAWLYQQGFCARPDSDAPDSFPPRISDDDVKVILKESTQTVHTHDEIDLTLAIQNRTSAAIKIFNPGCSVVGGDAAYLFVLDQRGRRLQRASHTLLDIGWGGDEKTFFERRLTKLAPGETAQFKCPLTVGGPDPGTYWSFMYIDSPSSIAEFRRRREEKFPDKPQLPPGRYRIRAYYCVDSSVIGQVMLGHQGLDDRYGPVWHGKSDSNEIEIAVKP